MNFKNLTILLLALAVLVVAVSFAVNITTTKPRTSSEIVIVVIDGKSLEELGMWEGNKFANLIDVLAGKGVKVIGFDIPFFERSDDDKKVEDALNNFDDVVFISEYKNFSTVNDTLIGTSIKKPVFRAPHYTGFGNMFADNDGVVRSFPTFINGADDIDSMDHFATAVVEEYLDEGVELKETGLLINYSGPPGYFPAISFVDVINNRTNFDFRGKIVLVGPTSPYTKDLFMTPASPIQKMPGVEIHANIIQTILAKVGKNRNPY